MLHQQPACSFEIEPSCPDKQNQKRVSLIVKLTVTFIGEAFIGALIKGFLTGVVTF